MKIREIKKISDFSSFLSNTGGHFIDDFSSEEYQKTICGTKFDAEVLYILPRTNTLDHLQYYSNLRFVTLNNYKLNKVDFKFLEKHKEKLKEVKFLDIWNVKQQDLELLQFFPSLEYLSISYIQKENFSFEGLAYVPRLHTLCLTSVNKLKDFNFITKTYSEQIEHLRVIYASRLNRLEGIENFTNLKTLQLYSSTMESRKKVVIESVSGLNKLTKLELLEFDYVKLDEEKLEDQVSGLSSLSEYMVNRLVRQNQLK